MKLTECVKKTGSKFDDVTCISRLSAHIKFYYVFPGASGNHFGDFFYGFSGYSAINLSIRRNFGHTSPLQYVRSPRRKTHQRVYEKNVASEVRIIAILDLTSMRGRSKSRGIPLHDTKIDMRVSVSLLTCLWTCQTRIAITKISQNCAGKRI